MDAQQVATKVTQLESRVAQLEDEGKIVKGEVKQILTEIRNTILVRDNPFENGSASAVPQPVAPVSHSIIELAPLPMREVAEAPRPELPPVGHATPASLSKEPVLLHPVAAQPLHAAAAASEPAATEWSLLTIAGLSAWAEEAMRRLGSLRLEILLDLCEAAGHLPPHARLALSRVVELDIPEPTQPPSNNETVVILRQLDALINDGGDVHAASSLHRA